MADTGVCEAPRKLTVLEEQVFWSDPDATMRALDAQKEWRVVLAYADTQIASNFYDKVRTRGDFERFSFLPMNVQLDCWLAIFRILVLGKGYIPAELVSRHMPAYETAKRAAKTPLTTREQEILELASKGKQNKMIAFDLGVSEHTVKLHMHHIIKKLGVHNRTEAVGQFLQGFPNYAGP